MNFYLVQRLEASPEGRVMNAFGSDVGVSKVLLDAGAMFDLADMGSSEFEYGAAAKSGNKIAAVASKLKIVSQQLIRPTYTEEVHFVCTPEQEEDLLPEWHEWTKNPSAIEPMAYFKDSDRDNIVIDPGRVVGWWALNEDLIWTREAEVAENIKSAFVSLTSQAS